MRGVHRLASVADRLQASYRRYAAGVLTGGSVALLLLGQFESPTVSRIEATLLDAVAVTVAAVNVPFEGAGMLIRDFDELVHAREENRRLHFELDRLRSQVTTLQGVESENLKLRELLALVPSEVPAYVSVQIVAAGTAVPRNTIVIDGGTRDGIRVGDPVVSLGRMAGYVTVAGERAARVQLLTSIASHVPVFGERFGHSAVVTGGKGGFLRFAYVGSSSSPTSFLEHEALYTSGQGGMFPPHLLVGSVERTEGGMRIRPAVDIEGMRYLQVVPSAPVDAVPAEQLL
ncbi:MAG: rod shape-determining protein MreC [Rhodospirillales bacterium]|nr:rod shape-determining protein MreC [Rhodospirillales bacterium]